MNCAMNHAVSNDGSYIKCNALLDCPPGSVSTPVRNHVSYVIGHFTVVGTVPPNFRCVKLVGKRVTGRNLPAAKSLVNR